MDVRPPITGLTPRPLLRPGTAIARHDDHHLQVGLDAPHRVVVPDRPEVRGLLGALADGAPLPDVGPTAWPVLRSLSDAGLLVDADAVATLGPPEPARTAWVQFGAGAPARLAARAAVRVGVRGGARVLETAGRLLRESGAAAADSGGRADVWLVVADGEVPRAAVDDLVRAEAPHLVLGGTPASRRLGPFVAPGLTACLRCVDAALAERDPRRALIVEQVATPLDTEGRPHDPALEAMALGWAVRDVLRFVEGERPSTWSTTYDLDPCGPPVARAWPRHPHCGCAWDVTWGDALAV